jgi:hypothetical protein
VICSDGTVLLSSLDPDSGTFSAAVGRKRVDEVKIDLAGGAGLKVGRAVGRRTERSLRWADIVLLIFVLMVRLKDGCVEEGRTTDI